MDRHMIFNTNPVTGSVQQSYYTLEITANRNKIKNGFYTCMVSRQDQADWISRTSITTLERLYCNWLPDANNVGQPEDNKAPDNDSWFYKHHQSVAS